MEYNIIQIKQSVTSNTLPELAPGELAFTQAGNNLFIGSPDGVSGNIRIAHKLDGAGGVVIPGEAIVANSTGGVDVIYATNVTANVISSNSINVSVVNTVIITANTVTVNNFFSGNVTANQVTVNQVTVGNVVANSVTANQVTAGQVNTANIYVQYIIANNDPGTNGYILTSGGSTSNAYWATLPTSYTFGNSLVNTNSTISVNAAYINTISANSAYYLGGAEAAAYIQNTDSRTLSGNINFTGANSYFDGKTTFNANLVLNAGISVIDSTGSQGDAGQVLTSNGTGNVYWAEVNAPAAFYYTNDMFDYTSFGIGWMNVAPNQNSATLGFRTDVTIPLGSIWILAINDGLVDDPPITIYSPSTRTTPMLWMTIDGTGPYDEITNPEGQAYWFNITPPPSGA